MANDNLVRTPFTISKSTDGVVYASTDIEDSTVASTLLTYSVPLGMAVQIAPENYVFGQYLNTSAAVIAFGETIISKSNATGAESREIFRGSNGIFGNIGDEFKRPRLGVGVLVNASEKLIVQVVSVGAVDLDVSASNFFIQATQVYEQI